jgi:hypothetical protein
MGAIAEDVFRTGTLSAANDVLELAQPGTATVLIQLIVTGTNTTVFEVNVDQGSSPTWVAIDVINVNTGAAVSSATASGIFRAHVSGAREFRVRSSAWTSGSAVVSMNGSVASAASGAGSSSITSVVPGTAATSLGKAEDAAHTSGDTGVMMLGVQQTTQAPLGANGDYEPPLLDGNGSTRVVAGGYTIVLNSNTLTRAANTTIYTTGDELADLTTICTLTAIARFSGGTGVIQGITAIFSDNWTTKPSLELWLFDTTSTIATDNGAFVPTDAETATCFAIVPLTAFYVGEPTTGTGSSTTGNMVMDTGQISVPFQCVGSANLFVRLVVRNAAQAGANSSTVKLRVRALCD